MKDLLKYSKLWRKKRDELNINANPDADWLDMQQVLNKHLPQTPGTGGANNLAKFFKAGPIAGFFAVAIVATYLIAHFAGSKINKQQRPDSAAGKRDTMMVSKVNPQADTAANVVMHGKSEVSANDSAVHKGIVNQTTNKASINSSPVLGANRGVSNSNQLVHHSNQIVNGVNVRGRTNASAPHGVPFIVNNSGLKPVADRSAGNNTGNNHLVNSNNPVQIDSIKNILPAGSVGDTTQRQPNAFDKQGDLNNEKKQPGLNDSAGVKKAVALSSIGQTDVTNVADGLAKFLIDRTKNDIKQAADNKKNKGNKKDKRKKPTNANDTTAKVSRVDWGLLAGVNTSGSFTPKSQNSNIYGSFPIDAYVGLFGTYHFSEKWATGLQMKALNPQKISGGYNHANGSKVDSGKIIQVTDERKAWFVSLPIYIAYKLTDNLSLKAGPVINIPVKQISINNSLTPTTIKKDTVYYKKVTGQINAARYDQKINLGLSGGVGLEFGRFNIDATYFKSLSGYNVISDFGSYNVNSGSLQFTVGFKFNKSR